MAVETVGLSGSRRLVTPRQLGALFVAIAGMVMALYLWQTLETSAPKAEGLSQSAIENSRAFVREQGVPQAVASESIFGSGAYIREFIGTAAVLLSPEAILNSGAHAREFGGSRAVVLTAEVILNSAAAAREAVALRETPYVHNTWAQAREAMAPRPQILSDQAILNSGAHIREAAG